MATTQIVSINPAFKTPARVLVKTEPSRVIGAVVPEWEEHLPDSASFAGFFLVDGKPVTPEDATAAIKAGARFDNVKEAHRAIEALIEDVGLPVEHSHLQRHHAAQEAHWNKEEAPAAPVETQGRYRAPLAAHHKATHAERVERALEKVGMKADDDLGAATPIFFTVAEMAQILDVSEKLVYRMAGVDLPAPLKIGGVLRFRSTAVLAMLAQQS